MKKLLLLALCALLTAALLGCTSGIKAKSADIQIGMSYEEVVALLGEEGTDVGSGFVIYEWSCGNGEYLHVWFGEDGVEDFEIGEKLVTP